MDEFDNKNQREEIYSKAVRAGKRTYFFDVKATKSGEQYITITESKRRFNQDQGKFFYEKHKLFLYKEDFDKFHNGLNKVVQFIETGVKPDDDDEPIETHEHHTDINQQNYSDVDFDNLGDDRS
mgnify:CR=1 FL=1